MARPTARGVRAKSKRSCLHFPTSGHQRVKVVESPARARRLAMPTARVRSAMAIGSHGTGRGGTVGDDRTGRWAELGKALSFSSRFVRAGAETVAATRLQCLWRCRGARRELRMRAAAAQAVANAAREERKRVARERDGH